MGHFWLKMLAARWRLSRARETKKGQYATEQYKNKQRYMLFRWVVRSFKTAEGGGGTDDFWRYGLGRRYPVAGQAHARGQKVHGSGYNGASLSTSGSSQLIFEPQVRGRQGSAEMQPCGIFATRLFQNSPWLECRLSPAVHAAPFFG